MPLSNTIMSNEHSAIKLCAVCVPIKKILFSLLYVSVPISEKVYINQSQTENPEVALDMDSQRAPWRTGYSKSR